MARPTEPSGFVSRPADDRIAVHVDCDRSTVCHRFVASGGETSVEPKAVESKKILDSSAIVLVRTSQGRAIQYRRSASAR